MNKIVRFFRTFAAGVIKALLGTVIVVLYLLKSEAVALWMAHIWMLIYLGPIAYELAGSFNFAFCCNPALKSERNSGFRKKVNLNSFWKKFFCGYDNGGNMLWLPLTYQCLLLAYIAIFLLLNVIFVVTFIMKTAILTKWTWIWIFEICALLVLFAIAMILTYSKDIYLWSKTRKNPECIHKTDSIGLVKRDTKMLKNRKMIKQKSAIFDFLKRYGVYRDKHNHYIVDSNDLKQIEGALTKEFPKLCLAFSENQSGMKFFDIYDAKKEVLLMQMKITKS